MTEHDRKTAPVVFQSLAWAFLLVKLLGWVYVAIKAPNPEIIVSSLIDGDVKTVINTAFLLTCLAAVFHHPAAAHLVRTTGLWSIAITASSISPAVLRLCSPVLPSDSPYSVPGFPLWATGLILLWLLVMTVMVAVANSIAEHPESPIPSADQPAGTDANTARGPVNRGGHRLTGWERLFLVGLGAIVMLLLVRVGVFSMAETPAPANPANVAITWLMITATVIMTVAQCGIRRYFWATGSVTMTAIALFLPAVAQFLVREESVASGISSASCREPLEGFLLLSLLNALPFLIVAFKALLSREWPWPIRLTPIVVVLTLLIVGNTHPHLILG